MPDATKELCGSIEFWHSGKLAITDAKDIIRSKSIRSKDGRDLTNGVCNILPVDNVDQECVILTYTTSQI